MRHDQPLARFGTFSNKERHGNKSGGDEMKTKSAPSEVTLCGRSYDEYIEMIKAFHGHVAPEVVLVCFNLYSNDD
jgi:hypothetical protein